jgi:hypothetical protein
MNEGMKEVGANKLSIPSIGQGPLHSTSFMVNVIPVLQSEEIVTLQR